MTREEEILAEAHKVAKKAYITVGTLPKSTLVAIGCDMAVWADEHPRKGLVDIEKVCEFVLKNLRNYVEYSKVIDGIVCYNYKFSEDLRKAMEE